MKYNPLKEPLFVSFYSDEFVLTMIPYTRNCFILLQIEGKTNVLNIIIKNIRDTRSEEDSFPEINKTEGDILFVGILVIVIVVVDVNKHHDEETYGGVFWGFMFRWESP